MCVRECRVDAIRDDLATCNRSRVYDDHTAPEMGGGELLDVDGVNACSDSDTNADQETAADLVVVCKQSN